MNKITYAFLVCLFSSVGLMAQTVEDGLLYSTEELGGTARFMSMSGAFGALGGDLSALNANPASSAVFKNSLASVSLQHDAIENTTQYYNNAGTAKRSSLAFNQAGGAFVLENNNSDWKKIALAFNYQQTQNFNQNFVVKGQSPNSISSYFLDHAYFGNSGGPIAYGDIDPDAGGFIEDVYLDLASFYGYSFQQAFLGIVGGVIAPEDSSNPDNIVYNSSATPANGLVHQEYYYTGAGNANKLNFNLSTQYKDDWYFGLNLNLHTLFREQDSRLVEDGYDSSSELNYVVFDNYLRTTGAGGSFQLGVIKKFDNFRLGVSYQSPTWYEIEEEQSQRIDSNLAHPDVSFINYNLVTLFRPYRLRTPSKIGLSSAWVIKKSGLISVEYNYRDYNNIRMRPNSSFSGINSVIGSELNGASSVKIGGEYRWTNWSFRGGYRYEESPYKNQDLTTNLQGYSLGFGYNFGRTRLDIAYMHTQQETLNSFHDSVLGATQVDQNKNLLTASLQYQF